VYKILFLYCSKSVINTNTKEVVSTSPVSGLVIVQYRIVFFQKKFSRALALLFALLTVKTSYASYLLKSDVKDELSIYKYEPPA